jgi:hypothetical protein
MIRHDDQGSKQSIVAVTLEADCANEASVIFGDPQLDMSRFLQVLDREARISQLLADPRQVLCSAGTDARFGHEALRLCRAGAAGRHDRPPQQFSPRNATSPLIASKSAE